MSALRVEFESFRYGTSSDESLSFFYWEFFASEERWGTKECKSYTKNTIALYLWGALVARKN